MAIIVQNIPYYGVLSLSRLRVAGFYWARSPRISSAPFFSPYTCLSLNHNTLFIIQRPWTILCQKVYMWNSGEDHRFSPVFHSGRLIYRTTSCLCHRMLVQLHVPLFGDGGASTYQKLICIIMLNAYKPHMQKPHRRQWWRLSVRPTPINYEYYWQVWKCRSNSSAVLATANTSTTGDGHARD